MLLPRGVRMVGGGGFFSRLLLPCSGLGRSSSLRQPSLKSPPPPFLWLLVCCVQSVRRRKFNDGVG